MTFTESVGVRVFVAMVLVGAFVWVGTQLLEARYEQWIATVFAAGA